MPVRASGVSFCWKNNGVDEMKTEESYDEYDVIDLFSEFKRKSREMRKIIGEMICGIEKIILDFESEEPFLSIYFNLDDPDHHMKFHNFFETCIESLSRHMDVNIYFPRDVTLCDIDDWQHLAGMLSYIRSCSWDTDSFTHYGAGHSALYAFEGLEELTLVLREGLDGV